MNNNNLKKRIPQINTHHHFRAFKMILRFN
jgi:hypothetical protein